MLCTSARLLCVMAALFLAAGCAPMGGPAAKAALLRLSFGGSATKGFAPENAAIARVHLRAAGPGGLATEADSEAGSALSLELASGAWSLSASGFSASGTELGAGTLALSLAPGEERSATLALLPKNGPGSLLLSWTVVGEPGGVLRIEGALKGPGGAREEISDEARVGQLRVAGLSSWNWTLELRLVKDGSVLCGLADSVLILAGLETKAAVCFEPPAASLGLLLALPDFAPRPLDLRPPLRRAAQGAVARFKAAGDGAASYSWYRDGTALSPAGAELELALGSQGTARIDCIEGEPAGAAAESAASNSARLRSLPPFSLGSLSWVETVAKEDAASGSASFARGLGGLRSLAFSPDGRRLAVAGKDSNALSVFSCRKGASSFLESSLGASSSGPLVAPERLAFLEPDLVALLSPSKGALYTVALGEGSASVRGELDDALLAGASSIAGIPGARSLALASTAADKLCLVELDGSGRPIGIRTLASKADAGLELLSQPACVAVSAAGDCLALGSAGDDALYFFTLSPGLASAALAARIDQAACAALGSLSNPCDLRFSPDGASLFLLCYSSRTLFRFDKDASGAFVPAAAAKSGAGGVAGFAYPRALALSRDGSRLAVVGSGGEDGLALFAVEAKGGLSYLGSALPSSNAGEALPAKPIAADFSPTGGAFVLGAEGRIAFYEY